VPAVEKDGPATKKKTVHASERDRPQVRLARRRYRRQIRRFPIKKLRFIDESGLHIAMTRRYGRAVRGQRVHDAVPKNTGRNLTILGALSCRGLDAVMTVEGATDALVFQAYGERVLAPTLRRGDVVVMDNLSAHKGLAVAAAIAATGAQLRYLPSYSPDYSPIENCWSKLKTLLRGQKARTREALDQALATLIPTISPSDAKGWFAHCGYPLN
jgi:transposase